MDLQAALKEAVTRYGELACMNWMEMSELDQMIHGKQIEAASHRVDELKRLIAANAEVKSTMRKMFESGVIEKVKVGA